MRKVFPKLQNNEKCSRKKNRNLDAAFQFTTLTFLF